MATVLAAIVLVSTVVLLGFGAYSLRTLIGRWDQPKRSILDPIPRFPAPRTLRQAPLERVAQAPIVMPVVAAPIPAPAPMPPLAMGTPIPVVAKPVVQPAVQGTLSTYHTKHQPPPRAAKGSVPPPLPPNARPMPMSMRPARGQTPSVIVEDFADEDATSPDAPQRRRN